MAAAIRWKIWYDDETTFSSDDGLPSDAPADGIIAVVEKQQDRTVNVLEGGDYFLWLGENWVMGHQASLERWLRKLVPELKYGRWTNNGIFREAMQEANRWP